MDLGKERNHFLRNFQRRAVSFREGNDDYLLIVSISGATVEAFFGLHARWFDGFLP